MEFFISYTRVDVQWARWIAWQLEGAGYQTFIQDWDIRPGANFVIEMQRAAEQAERTVAVLSPDYLTSCFTLPEWAAAVAQDPTGSTGVLLPVRIRIVDLRGLLKAIVYIDLVGLSEEDAKEALLNGACRARSKPPETPAFPGERAAPVVVPSYPVAAPVERDPFRDWTFVEVRTTDEGDLAFLFRPASSRRVVGVPSNLTRSQVSVLDRLVANVQHLAISTDKLRGRLATLLVPDQLKEPIAKAASVCFAVDGNASRYPWELLCAPTGATIDGEQTSATSNVLRTLPELPVRGFATLLCRGALVIGSPELPSASSEVGLVEHMLTRDNRDVRVIFSEDPSTLISALYRKPYEIVHIVGRGHFDPENRHMAGVHLNQNLAVTPGEFLAMETPPALVFFNVGTIDGPSDAARPLRHGELAAHFAEGLLRAGVRCVIATGWAVDDREAAVFVGEFYHHMGAGAPFHHAIERARHATYRSAPLTNSWGAFFCYGRPDFVLSSAARHTASANSAAQPLDGDATRRPSQ